MATMKDVAREAGVSLGTVSNVLNNVPSVSQENRYKVMEAVSRLKFRPNTAARILKTKTSKSIGLIIPDITNPFYPELARGVEDAAKRAGLAVFLCNNDRSADKELEYIDLLMEKNVDGMILVKPSISRHELKSVSEGCNIVLVDTNTDYDKSFDVINVNDYDGTLKAMTLLYEYGHRRIAFISGMMESRSSKLRYEAYVHFLENNNLPMDQSLQRRGTYDWYSGYTAGVELLRQLNPPTAIYAANDLMAIGVLKAARERRLNVPFDLSVIGFDDIGMASLCTPQLTTIRQPKYEIGTAAVEMLIKRFNSPDRGNTEQGGGGLLTLETEIILRESAGYAKKI